MNQKVIALLDKDNDEKWVREIGFHIRQITQQAHGSTCDSPPNANLLNHDLI